MNRQDVLCPRSELPELQEAISDLWRTRDMLAALLLQLGGTTLIEHQPLGEATFLDIVYEPIDGRGVRLSLRAYNE